MEELRECPFCGNEMKKFHWPDHNRPWRSFDYWTCTSIGCPSGELKIQIGDIDTFNTRASDAAIRELVGALHNLASRAAYFGYGFMLIHQLAEAEAVLAKHKPQTPEPIKKGGLR